MNSKIQWAGQPKSMLVIIGNGQLALVLSQENVLNITNVRTKTVDGKKFCHNVTIGKKKNNKITERHNWPYREFTISTPAGRYFFSNKLKVLCIL